MSEVCGGCGHSKFAHRLGPCESAGCKCEKHTLAAIADGTPFMICRMCGTTFTVCQHIENGYMKLENENKELKAKLEAAERRVKDLEYSVRLARETLPDLGELQPEPGSLATQPPDELEKMMERFKDSYPALYDMLKRMERKAQKTALFGFLYGKMPDELREAVDAKDLEKVKALIKSIKTDDFRRYAKQASFTEALEMGRAELGEPREVVIDAGDEVEKTWQLHWMPLLETAAAEEKISIKEQIKRELYDYSTLLDSVPKVYQEVTGGKVSKANTKPEAVVEMFREHVEKERQDAIDEALGEYTGAPTKIEARTGYDFDSWVVRVFNEFYLAPVHTNEESAKQQEKAFLEALVGFEKALQTPPGMARIPITPTQHAMLVAMLIFLKNGEWKPELWTKERQAIFEAVRDSVPG